MMHRLVEIGYGVYNVPVSLSMPRLELSSVFDLVSDGALKSMGITDALNQELADFSGVHPSGSWVTATVKQRHEFQFSGLMMTIEGRGDTCSATWNHRFLVVSGSSLSARPVPWISRPMNRRRTRTGDGWRLGTSGLEMFC